MASKKKNVVRCVVCGVKATRMAGGVTPLCNNEVCYHTMLNEAREAEKNKK